MVKDIRTKDKSRVEAENQMDLNSLRANKNKKRSSKPKSFEKSGVCNQERRKSTRADKNGGLRSQEMGQMVDAGTQTPHLLQDRLDGIFGDGTSCKNSSGEQFVQRRNSSFSCSEYSITFSEGNLVNNETAQSSRRTSLLSPFDKKLEINSMFNEEVQEEGVTRLCSKVNNDREVIGNPGYELETEKVEMALADIESLIHKMTMSLSSLEPATINNNLCNWGKVPTCCGEFDIGINNQ